MAANKYFTFHFHWWIGYVLNWAAKNNIPNFRWAKFGPQMKKRLRSAYPTLLNIYL